MKTIFYIIIAMFLGIGIIITLNITKTFNPISSQYLSPNEVRGIAIERKGLLYTLNFEQQNSLIDALNRSIPIGKDIQDRSDTLLEFTKIVLYRFDKPNIVVEPIAYVKRPSPAEKNLIPHDFLIFSVPEWNAQGLLQETLSGDIKTITSQAYDP